MNDKYEALVGKIGLALLGESDTKKYQMILYQNKQKPLTNVRITPGFAIIVSDYHFRFQKKHSKLIHASTLEST